jgi:hypothetical protein
MADQNSVFIRLFILLAGVVLGILIGVTDAAEFWRRADALMIAGAMFAMLVFGVWLAQRELVPGGAVVLAAGGLLGAGALADQVPWHRAGLLLLLGSAAFLAAMRTVRLLIGEDGNVGDARDRHKIELRSEWSGLGGGFGGWSLSRAAGMIVVTFVLVVATAIVGLSREAKDTPAAKMACRACSECVKCPDAKPSGK